MRLGQHFLIDNSVAERQVSYAALSTDDVVLEIGGGTGVLTRLLAKVVKRVIVIEIDRSLAQSLISLENVDVIPCDALSVNFDVLGFDKVVSNLPYQISSPITFKLLDVDFLLGVLMYQKEFAERLVAKPGNKQYSRLSVMAQYTADWNILEEVSPKSFNPKPKVSSNIVQMIPRAPQFNVADKNMFNLVTRILFSHRRKTIRNALLSEKLISQKMLKEIPYLHTRVEQLTPKEIGLISDVIFHLIRENESSD